MTVEIQKDDDGPGSVRKGAWRLWHGRVLLRCPECGDLGTLAAPDHQVAPDGTVTPSIQCARTGCKFHVNGKLLGWVERPHA